MDIYGQEQRSYQFYYTKFTCNAVYKKDYIYIYMCVCACVCVCVCV